MSKLRKYIKDETIKSETSNIVSAVGDLLIGAPIIGISASIGKIYGSFREQAFAEKLESFLREAQPNRDKGERFKLAIKGNESSFYKKLWVIIDKLDDSEKATITGKFFKKVLNGDHTVEDFLEAADVIQRMYIGHLKSLKKEYLLGDNKGASNLQHRFQLIQHGHN